MEYEAACFPSRRGSVVTAWGVKGPDGQIVDSSPYWSKKEAVFYAARFQEIHDRAVNAEREAICRHLEARAAAPEWIVPGIRSHLATLAKLFRAGYHHETTSDSTTSSK